MNKSEPNDPRRKSLVRKLPVLALIAAAFALGYYFADDRGAGIPAANDPQKAPHVEASHRTAEHSATKSVETELWTCSMHPQIKLAHPGKCPICGMDLVPVGTGGAHKRLRQYSMSPAARKLAQVETTVVKRERGALRVRMVGMVFEDETRVAALTSRVDGRLDEVHVNFTGVKVNKGDPMVTIWSPTLIRSQVELFETIRSQEYGETVVKGSEEKLKQFGLTDAQIREIREKKTPIPYTTLRAPISGVVMKKNVVLGDFVKEGTVMYEITDLSKVWIKLDAYESDLPWIRYGQEVTFTTQSVPGRKFKGKVLFIDPVVQMDSRSIKVRVEAENPDLLLKPHMFVTAEVEAELDRYGRVINREWAGKYICPVHPDSVSPEPGICPRSKLPRRPAEAYGYAPDLDPMPPLVVPATAVLYTGKRSLVYVETPDTDMPTYEARQVVLGPRAGDKYVVYQGLKVGERVVTKGNFKIDSAAQILAGASMMNPAGPAPAPSMARKTQRSESAQSGDGPHSVGGSGSKEGSGGAHGDRPQGSRSKNESSRHDSHSASE